MPFVSAQALTVGEIVDHAKVLVSSLIPLFIGLALVYFVYGLAQYIGVSGQEAKKEEGRTRMLWGVIAMFVIISVWGLVTLLQATIFTTGSGASLTEPPQPKFSI